MINVAIKSSINLGGAPSMRLRHLLRIRPRYLAKLLT
jgi:hypothetical protein